MKYYVDAQGNYLGGFNFGNPSVPAGAIEVSSPPENGKQIWNGVSWDDSTAELEKHLAHYRWLKENGGIIYQGLPIASDDRSKLLLDGAYSKALEEANPGAVKKFKSQSGFVSITNQVIIDVALALADHVEKCFAAEANTYDKIQNGTVTTVSEVEADFDAEFAALT